MTKTAIFKKEISHGKEQNKNLPQARHPMVNEMMDLRGSWAGGD